MNADITIKDVARQANVSISTVSRVLNGLDRVSSKTRKKVLKVIEDMSYVPNNVAVSMVKKQTKMIVVMVPDIINPFYTSLIQGTEEVAKAMGYFTLVFSTNDDETEEREFFSGVLSKTVDGIITVSSSKTLDFYKSFSKPVVLVDRYIENCGLDGVVIDNFGGAYQAAKNLLEMGHKKIAIINGSLDFNIGKERLWGFEQALRDYKVPIISEYIKQGDWYEDNGYSSMVDLLKMSDPPTAVFASNNLICVGAIKALYDLNIRIGEEISIVGFDENELAEFTRPKITVVNRPTFKMGKTAARMLLDKIKGNRESDASQKITLSTELITRGSVKKIDRL